MTILNDPFTCQLLADSETVRKAVAEHRHFRCHYCNDLMPVVQAWFMPGVYASGGEFCFQYACRCRGHSERSTNYSREQLEQLISELPQE